MKENINKEFNRHESAINKIDRIRKYYRNYNKMRRSASDDQENKISKRRRTVTLNAYSSSRNNIEEFNQSSHVSIDDLDVDDEYDGEGL